MSSKNKRGDKKQTNELDEGEALLRRARNDTRKFVGQVAPNNTCFIRGGLRGILTATTRGLGYERAAREIMRAGEHSARFPLAWNAFAGEISSLVHV